MPGLIGHLLEGSVRQLFGLKYLDHGSSAISLARNESVGMYVAYLLEIFLFQMSIQLFNKVPFLKAVAEIDFLPNVSNVTMERNNLGPCEGRKKWKT